MENQEIHLGSATLLPHFDGGWALPGGARVDDRDDALAAVRAMSELIGPSAPTRVRAPKAPVQPRLVRRAAVTDHALVSRC